MDLQPAFFGCGFLIGSKQGGRNGHLDCQGSNEGRNHNRTRADRKCYHAETIKIWGMHSRCRWHKRKKKGLRAFDPEASWCLLVLAVVCQTVVDESCSPARERANAGALPAARQGSDCCSRACRSGHNQYRVARRTSAMQRRPIGVGRRLVRLCVNAATHGRVLPMLRRICRVWLRSVVDRRLQPSRLLVLVLARESRICVHGQTSRRHCCSQCHCYHCPNPTHD